MSMDYWLQCIDGHNKYKQTAQIRNRNRVVLEDRRAYHSIPVMSLYPQGEYTHGGKRFTCTPNGVFDVYWYSSPFWRCDPVERTLRMAYPYTPGTPHAWVLRRLFPHDVRVSFVLADRWREGEWAIDVGDQRLTWSPELVLHVPKNGETTVVEGGIPATKVNVNPEALKHLRYIRKRIRAMRELWEPMRSSTGDNNLIFCTEAIMKRMENRGECLTHVLAWATSDKDHDPRVYASYIAMSRSWLYKHMDPPGPKVSEAERLIRRAVMKEK